MFVGPCHHGMARPQVAVGGTASDMEGCCEYIDHAVVESRQAVVLRLGDFGEVLTNPHRKNWYSYET